MKEKEYEREMRSGDKRKKSKTQPPPVNEKRKRRKSRRNRRKSAFIKKLILVLVIIAVLATAIVTAIQMRKKAIREREAKEVEVLKAQAEALAKQYDYKGAIAVLQTGKQETQQEQLQELIRYYDQEDLKLVPYSAKDVTHVFYHSLIVDPELAFTKSGSKGFKQWMVTVEEFNRATQTLYDNGYVLVSIYDLVDKKEENGKVHFVEKKIFLPEGKKPLILSLDDLSYYHSYEEHGIASRLVLDETGEVTCEYIQRDGTTVTGAYDCVPLLNEFVKQHPDASYHGAKGIIALTGYNGIFGYRTDIQYKIQEENEEDEIRWLQAHPDFDWDKECEEAKRIAEELKREGWTFASHTWGHWGAASISEEHLKKDTEKWKSYVEPLIGDTDIIIFAHGEDMANSPVNYPGNPKFEYLKQQGFRCFMNVDSTQRYSLKVFDEYVHQTRRNIDGYSLWQDARNNGKYFDDMFDARQIIDPIRTDMPDL